jgi:hypothetical protein
LKYGTRNFGVVLRKKEFTAFEKGTDSSLCVSNVHTTDQSCSCDYEVQFDGGTYKGVAQFFPEYLTISAQISKQSTLGEGGTVHLKVMYEQFLRRVRDFIGPPGKGASEDEGESTGGDKDTEKGECLGEDKKKINKDFGAFGYVLVPYENETIIGCIQFDGNISISIFKSGDIFVKLHKDFESISSFCRKLKEPLGRLNIKKVSDEGLSVEPSSPHSVEPAPLSAVQLPPPPSVVSGQAFSFIPELSFECDIPSLVTLNGSYKDYQLNIQKFQCKVGQKLITSSEICVDFKQKRVEPIKITVDSYGINTSAFYFESEELRNKPNSLTWAMTSIPLYTSNKKMYFGDLDIQGSIEKNLGEIKFNLSPSPKVSQSILRLNVTADGVVRVSKDRIVLESLHINTPDNSQIRASLEVHSSKFLDLISALSKIANQEPILDSTVHLSGKIDGTLSLKPISVFLNTGDAISGKVSTALDISGTIAAPNLAGTFSLANGYYEHFSNGIILKNITLAAKGDGSALKITEVRLDDGTFRGDRSAGDWARNVKAPPQRCAGGNGALTLLSPNHVYEPRLLLNLCCNFLQVAYGNVVKARASGGLKLDGPLTGKSSTPMITGDVSIDDMTVSVSTDTAQADSDNWTVFENGKPILVPKTKVSVSKNQGGRFGMNVKLTGNVVVQTNGLKCFLTGSMLAKGSIVSPYLVGQMTANTRLSSQYNLFGKIMSVNSGFVSYDENNINDPYIKVVLATKINRIDIFATLSGRLSNTSITLQSHPPQSSEEILSLLLFGQGLNQLSADQNSRIRAFSSHMLQGNPLSFIDKLRNKLKLDSLEVVDTQDMSSGETTQSVRVGKKIKNAKIFIDQDLSQKNNSKMTVRYDITPEIGLDANIGTNRGSSGVGIQWMKRY